MKDEVVKVTEEAVEAVATNTENVYVIGAVGFVAGVATTLGVIKGREFLAKRKAKKIEQTEEVEVEE